MKHNFTDIEKKWQKKWEQAGIFRASEDKKKKKFYVLEMFPYPSALGLHLGHALNYTIGDILARFKRMNGFNVLYPMGFDAMGLPAENAAIKAGEHPKTYTKKAIRNYIRQMKNLGLSYDWSRIVNSMEPEYYRWNQLFFLKFLEKDLVYKKKSPVNWCQKCQTVLANEQVHNGKCWRHEDTKVEIKHLEQWFLKTTNYADELLGCIDNLQWPQQIKTMQKNWIGKSHGTEIDFEVETASEISNVVIVHGCPDENEARSVETRTYDKHWIPWIKKNLEEKGIKCLTPLMPESWKPNYKEWKEQFDKLLISENSVLIGHSCGCAFLVRWLGETKKKIKKLILVAPWKIPDGKSEVKKLFYNYDISESVKSQVKEAIIFTANDEEEDGKKSVKIFYNALGGKIIELKNHGHFTFDDMGTYEFPELLDEIISNQKFPVFTTRADTIYGVTFMVISAQHPRLMEFVTTEQKKEIEKFLNKIKSVSEKEQESLEKDGVFTGSYAINPITKEKVPIWAGNFVVADYGSGMVMGVPAHDQRDFEFAKKYGIEIKWVIEPKIAEYVVIEKSIKGNAENELKKSGKISIDKVDKEWGKFFRVKVDVDNEDKLIKFLEKNLLTTSDDGGAWYADSVGTSNVVVFPNKHFILKDKKDYEKYVRYGLSVGVPREQLDVELKAFTSDGILINSSQFNGLPSEKAREEIPKFLEKKNLGRKKVQFKLRDWLISRQRYWGTPIPIVYCEKCGIVSVPEKDLPVKLPIDVKFGKGNPLATNEKFVNVKCPKCKGKARRETDTMDTFVDSSWYYMRYADNKNLKEPFDKNKTDYWLPVDQYIGGIEHATMHLLYARFWTKALRDLGFVKFGEPFTKLFNQGMLHGSDGEKMSKSKGNVILPEVVSKKYGIDTARFFLMSLASPDKARDWSDEGVRGSLKFTKKIISYFENAKISKNSDAKTESRLNKTIKEVTGYIENFKYNLAIISLRDLFGSLPEKTSKDVLEKSLKLLHPFCPHITEELWEKIGGKGFISTAKWPFCDEKKIDENLEKRDELVKKLKSDIEQVKKLIGKDKANVYVYALPNEIGIYKNVKGINLFAVNDKNKYDPENKSKKVKPGRPGIYLG